MRNARKAYFGWKEDGRYYLSVYPKELGMARNVYASSTDALKDANSRHVAIVWDDPSVV